MTANEKPHIPPSEAAVLHWVMHGKTNNEIGAILGKSPLTVKRQVEKLIDRFGVVDRTSLAVAALQRGVVRLDTLELAEQAPGGGALEMKQPKC